MLSLTGQVDPYSLLCMKTRNAVVGLLTSMTLFGDLKCFSLYLPIHLNDTTTKSCFRDQVCCSEIGQSFCGMRFNNNGQGLLSAFLQINVM